MFTGLASFLGDDTKSDAEREYEEAQQRIEERDRFREYLLWRMHTLNQPFVTDDMDHGRRVIDATLALADALIEQRRRFGVDENRVALAEALVRTVLSQEGAHRLQIATAYQEFFDQRPQSIDLDAHVDERVVRTRLDPMSVRIIRAWLDTLDRSAAGRLSGTRVTGASRCFMPRETYEQWVVSGDERAQQVSGELCQSLTVSYTVIDGVDPETGEEMPEADHEVVARQAFAPLIEQVRCMLADAPADELRLDVTLNVELVSSRRRIIDDSLDEATEDDESTIVTDQGMALRTPAPSETLLTANCAVAYRLHRVPEQHSVITNE